MTAFDWFLSVVGGWCFVRLLLVMMSISPTKLAMAKIVNPEGYNNYTSLNRKYFYSGVAIIGILIWRNYG